jgi:hypothetical protein
MKKAIVAMLALALTGALAYAAAAFNVTGDWEFTMTTQRGPMVSQLKFVQDGEKLAVTMIREGRDGQMMESKGEGTLKGADIQWKIVRTGRDGQTMEITYTGKVTDDNTMNGTMAGGFGPPGGTQEPPAWKAVRKPK